MTPSATGDRLTVGMRADSCALDGDWALMIIIVIIIIRITRLRRFVELLVLIARTHCAYCCHIALELTRASKSVRERRRATCLRTRVTCAAMRTCARAGAPCFVAQTGQKERARGYRRRSVTLASDSYATYRIWYWICVFARGLSSLFTSRASASLSSDSRFRFLSLFLSLCWL